MTGSTKSPGRRARLLWIGIFWAHPAILLGAVQDVSWEERLHRQKSEMEKRLTLLDQLGIQPYEYAPGLSDEALNARFENIAKNRWLLYFTNPEDYSKPGGFGVYKPEFQTPAQWRNWKSRYPYPMAFEYNLADEDYDASLVTLGPNGFLAIEAPSHANQDQFHALVGKFPLKCFVQLNAANRQPEDYFPYWERWERGPAGQVVVGGRSFTFVSCDWPHRQGIEATDLYDVLGNVRGAGGSGAIAVSCRIAAGRTGTFIASYEILDAIARQRARGLTVMEIKINVDRIFWEVTVQRPFAITHASQYRTLYRIADFCLAKP